jgi:crotonobetaine/carnitine-CoA ligase
MGEDIARERVMHRLLERQEEKYGERTFMYFEGKEFSYKDVNNAANRVACALQKLGIVKGDKIAVVMENCPEVIFLMHGLSKIGAILVPINIFHKGEVMTYMVDHSESSTIVMHSQYIDRLGAVLKKTAKIKSVVVLEGNSSGQESGESSDISVKAIREQIGTLGKQVLAWSELIENDGNYRETDVAWSDPLMLLYTSGTTGLSKGVLLPQNLFYCQSERTYKWVLEKNIGENDCIYVPSPLFHAGGWHSGINLALLSGARILLVRKFSASKYWGDIKRYGCTYVSIGGPTLPILLLAEPTPHDADNPLRAVLAGPASEQLCATYEPRFGVKVLEFYGSTELGAPAMNQFSNRKIGSCGKILPDFDLKIVDDNGVEVGVNMPGEILVRPLQPYSMMLEYYNMPEKTVEAWEDLWFHTGDFARVDEDGFLFFVDRKKDSIRRRAENVSSFEVERVINSHPSILQSAVYAVKSEFSVDDEVMVSAVLKPGQNLSPVELTSFCEEQMAYFMVPRYVRFVDDLPKNAVNRVEKYKLREEGVTPDTWDREKSGYKLRR